jgi:dTDP-4-dehydrorhamnose 3,5-epimerase
MTSDRFQFHPTPLEGLQEVVRNPLGDSRGSLCRLFCEDAFLAAGVNSPINQINHTLTQKMGTVRGFHFQYPPAAEHKIVMCIRGKAFDVAVDLRAESQTFLRWHGVELSADNGCALSIPKGFAHGFQTQSTDCELLYFHNAPYAPEYEGCFHAEDPQIGVTWPLPVDEMSDKDVANPFISKDFAGIKL